VLISYRLSVTAISALISVSASHQAKKNGKQRGGVNASRQDAVCVFGTISCADIIQRGNMSLNSADAWNSNIGSKI